jgi:exodeoxyribonuclease VII large subunit
VNEPTFRVSELTTAIQTALEVCFPDEVWVQGEISSLSRSSAGHVYFQLIEPAEAGGPPMAQIAVTLFAGAKASVNATLKEGGGVRMTDGVEIRLRGRLSLYGPQGRLQLRMSAVDPDYTLGRLAGERERLLKLLAAQGLLERNGTRPLPVSPLRIGLVTSSGSAAEADFLHELEASGMTWRVTAVDTRVQGAGADRRVAAALVRLATEGVDVVAVVRGGGARTDLATFDSEIVARAIATLPLPVITGIGHETDRSLADEVAHHASKTPTACAAFLVSRARGFHDLVERGWDETVRRAQAQISHADRRLGASARSVAGLAQTSLVTGELGLGEATRRLARALPRVLEHAKLHLGTTANRVAALDPERALARGWSITRDGNGQLVRSVDDVRPGDALMTTLADGHLRSRVDAQLPDPPAGERPADLPHDDLEGSPR